jgi:hypothetical protein
MVSKSDGQKYMGISHIELYDRRIMSVQRTYAVMEGLLRSALVTVD